MPARAPYFLIFVFMFGLTAADATAMIGQVTTVGSAIVSAVVLLAGLFLTVAGFRWVFSLVRGALHL